tara:strand:+ start:521 stop:832 length:312 start_codon:yes stop_codon:yes gene_type:complete
MLINQRDDHHVRHTQLFVHTTIINSVVWRRGATAARARNINRGNAMNKITYTPIENDKLEATCTSCGKWLGQKAADGNTYTDDYVISLSYQEHKAQDCAGLCE